MNKPYFTKLIPVEGEINEKSIRDDELFYTDGKIYKRLAGSWTLHVDGTKSQYPIADRVQRVKLFLCSRDVSSEDYIVPKNVVHIEREEGYTPYKVIGEVSPAAIWAKPDMYFDEEDIEKSIRNIHTDAYRSYSESGLKLLKLANNGWYVDVKFKCPTCNTFH